MTSVIRAEQELRWRAISRPPKARPVQWAVKRGLDRLAAGLALTGLAPAGCLLGLAIRVESAGPALFIQERLGRDGRTFRMYKFRTLKAGAPIIFNEDGSTRVVAGDPRVTRLGRLLRGGIDELPQVINVLRGDMSFVGPRPDMPVHAALYTPERWQKLCVPPGMTSLAAILGRNSLPWQCRMALDLRYLDNWSLALDAKIVIATLCLPFSIRPFRFRDIAGDLLDDGK